MNFYQQSLDINKKSVEKSDDSLNNVNPNDSKLSIHKSKDSIQYQDSKNSTNMINDINYSNGLTELNQHNANKTDNRRYNKTDIYNSNENGRFSMDFNKKEKDEGRERDLDHKNNKSMINQD